ESIFYKRDHNFLGDFLLKYDRRFFFGGWYCAQFTALPLQVIFLFLQLLQALSRGCFYWAVAVVVVVLVGVLSAESWTCSGLWVVGDVLRFLLYPVAAGSVVMRSLADEIAWSDGASDITAGVKDVDGRDSVAVGVVGAGEGAGDASSAFSRAIR
ncbi:hypothetical protein DFS34DRAFT_668878, partial [Phlyctochytrium arcticum]